MDSKNVATAELFEIINPVKSKVGRPAGFCPEHIEAAKRLTRAGATRDAMALAFGIDGSTISEWMKKYPAFGSAIQNERWVADEQVAAALYKKATGFTRKVTKAMQHNGKPVLAEYTEEVAPDTAAAFIWLKNRQPDTWKDRHEVELSGGVSVNLSWVGGRQIVDAQDIDSRSLGEQPPHPETRSLEDSTPTGADS